MHGTVQKEQHQAGAGDERGIFRESSPAFRIRTVQGRKPQHDEKIPEYRGETAADKGRAGEGGRLPEAYETDRPIQNQQAGKVYCGTDQGMEPFRGEPSDINSGTGKAKGNVDRQKDPQSVHKYREKVGKSQTSQNPPDGRPGDPQPVR